MIHMQSNSLRRTLVLFALSSALTGLAHAQANVPEQSPLDDPSGKGGVAAFEEFAKYPPESRPLHTSNWDLLHPWLTDNNPAALVPLETFRQLETLQKA